MGDQSVTLYPGDTLSVTVSVGQAPGDAPADPSADDGEAIASEGDVAAAAEANDTQPPGAAPDVLPDDLGPAAGTVPSPVDHG